MENFHPLANSEAGNHPLPNDPREIDAALRAGRQSWEACPYYALRYGERGQSFTRSDSGYLVTLTNHDANYVQQQVAWLAGVLASRGMPSWLLEQHLYVLYKELCTAIPEHQPQYEKLHEAADWLKHRRIAQISESLGSRLADDFHRRVVNDPWLLCLSDPGGLLITAVADERNGLTEALPSLLAWLAEPQRFSSSWIEAINSTLTATRAAVSS